MLVDETAEPGGSLLSEPSVMIDGKPSWSLGFAHDSWTLASGKAFPIQLTFDGQAPVNVHGIAISDKLLRVPMPDTFERR